MVYKFDEPIPTKSGESVVKLWNEMKECETKLNRARMESDYETAKENAKRIQEIQDDLGITIEDFPEFHLKGSLLDH